MSKAQLASFVTKKTFKMNVSNLIQSAVVLVDGQSSAEDEAALDDVIRSEEPLVSEEDFGENKQQQTRKRG